MGIALVQVNQTEGVSTSISLAFATNNVAGNFLWYGWSHTSTGADVLSDTRNTPNIDVALAGTAFFEAQVCSVVNCGAGANTVQVTGAGSKARTLIIAEYSGIVTVNPFDKTASTTGSSTAMNSGATATTTAAYELLIGFGPVDAATGSPYTAGVGWNGRVDLAGGSLDTFMEDQIVGVTGAYSATATMTSGPTWRMVITTYIGVQAPFTVQKSRLRPAPFRPGLAR